MNDTEKYDIVCEYIRDISAAEIANMIFSESLLDIDELLYVSDLIVELCNEHEQKIFSIEDKG